jgi:hypothetical protein
MTTTTAAPKEENNKAEVQWHVSCQKVLVVAAATADGWDHEKGVAGQWQSVGSLWPPGQFGTILECDRVWF